METLISDLVNRFQHGGITRRELIRSLSMLVAAGGTAGTAAAATGSAATPAAAAPVAATAGAIQQAGLHGTGIDHVSILVSDLQRSAAFYRDLFGMSAVSEDKPHQILRLGTDRTIVSLRHEGQPGLVDHFAIRVDNFNRDAVTQVLKQRGLTPQENIEFGFHVKDPDGAVVQIV